MDAHADVLRTDAEHVGDFLIAKALQLQHQGLPLHQRKSGQRLEQPATTGLGAWVVIRRVGVVILVVEGQGARLPSRALYVIRAKVVGDPQYIGQQSLRIPELGQGLPHGQQHVLEQFLAQRRVEFVTADRAPDLRRAGLGARPERVHG